MLRAGLTGHNYGSFSVIKPWSVSSHTKGRALISNEAPPPLRLIRTHKYGKTCTHRHTSQDEDAHVWITHTYTCARLNQMTGMKNLSVGLTPSII